MSEQPRRPANPPADPAGETPPVRHGQIPTPDPTANPVGRPGVPSPLAPGSSVGGFRIERALGVGGMGAVYLATDTQLGRKVAVKVMRPDLAADPAANPAAKARFLREARAAAAVEHENVVGIYAVGEEAGTPYLVMPLLKGEPLDARLRRAPATR